MGKEKCPQGQHIWSCRQVEGAESEIKKYKILEEPEVLKITEDASWVQIICPGGQIVCQVCEGLWPSGEKEAVQPLLLNQISSNLIRPE